MISYFKSHLNSFQALWKSVFSSFLGKRNTAMKLSTVDFSFTCANVMALFIGLFLICLGTILLFQTDIKSGPINLVLDDAYASKVRNITQIALLVNGLPQYIDSIGLGLFLFGVVLVFFSLIMTRKSFRTSKQFLIVYICAVSFVLLLLIIMTIMTGVEMKSFGFSGKLQFRKYLRQHFFGIPLGNLTLADPFSLVMIAHNCCGINNGSDFRQEFSPEWQIRGHDDRVPWTCCKLKSGKQIVPIDPKCTSQPNSNNSYVHNGCFKKLWVIVNDLSKKFIAGFVVFDLLLMVIVFIACVFRVVMREVNRRMTTEMLELKRFDYAMLTWREQNKPCERTSETQC